MNYIIIILTHNNNIYNKSNDLKKDKQNLTIFFQNTHIKYIIVQNVLDVKNSLLNPPTYYIADSFIK